jgi:hypothetical protein
VCDALFVLAVYNGYLDFTPTDKGEDVDSRASKSRRDLAPEAEYIVSINRQERFVCATQLRPVLRKNVQVSHMTVVRSSGQNKIVDEVLQPNSIRNNGKSC